MKAQTDSRRWNNWAQRSKRSTGWKSPV